VVFGAAALGPVAGAVHQTGGFLGQDSACRTRELCFFTVESTATCSCANETNRFQQSSGVQFELHPEKHAGRLLDRENTQ
jgi:hypothetical protein